MGNIEMSGKEYLLYLRARQDRIEEYILERFKAAKKHRLSKQEICQMVEAEFRCELPVDDTENIILKGVITNLLDSYEVKGWLEPVATKYGPGYHFIGDKIRKAA